ncbi:MAG: hypothetical protein UX17_C0030G0016 [Parcubacteria group bacterium GW2011_GWC2_45_7]|nr:MAG: hypothetical protein UX17_C0030G0016 [Parcubacteria group bacterium GW2011_GWC2_45_7]KKU74010.1 MAG: hypothetical protein UX98_C0002G0040 [Parcubacteria group bacterium GW2011_GWA2_47_26]
MQDEILVKGTDGKWYLLQGEELVPYGAGTQGPDKQAAGVKQELPKGVTEERHKKLEKVTKAVEEPHVAKEIFLPAVATPPLPAVSAPALRDLVTAAGATRDQVTAPAYIPPELPELVAPALGPVTHEGHPLYKELQELVDQVVSESAEIIRAQAPAWDEILQKRFRFVISARLRDMRDAAETKALILRDQKIGGLGLREADAQKVTEFTERVFQEFQKKWQEFEAKRIEEWKRKKREEAAHSEEVCKKKEEQEMEERYARLTGEVAKVAEVANEPKIKVPKPQTSNLKPQTAPNIKAQKPRIIEQSRTSVTSETFATSVTLPRSSKVTDVRTPPKLLGPVEELQSISPQDFRRLGAPGEATAKIKAKVDFLAQESFTKYRNGIKAWQSSPLHRLYLFISGISLRERKSIEQVIGDLQVQNKDTLTPDEFHAIMELNKQLRF